MRQNLMTRVFRIIVVIFTLLICLLPASATATYIYRKNNAENDAYLNIESTNQTGTLDCDNEEEIKTEAAIIEENKTVNKAEVEADKNADTKAKKTKAAAMTEAATGVKETARTEKASGETAKTPVTSNKAAETTKAPAKTSSVQEIERQVVILVNQVRKQNGLNELTLNEELSNVARIKAKDMAENNYFSHTSPTYGSPFDMIKQFGIGYRTAGENIAMGQTTAQKVFDGWMNSEGHRANILNPSFTQIGVGYTSNGNYWAQMFIG